VKVEQLRSTVTGLGLDFDFDAIRGAISVTAPPLTVAKAVIPTKNKAIAVNVLVFIIIMFLGWKYKD
jgi:hypothetical protein